MKNAVLFLSGVMMGIIIGINAASLAVKHGVLTVENQRIELRDYGLGMCPTCGRSYNHQTKFASDRFIMVLCDTCWRKFSVDQRWQIYRDTMVKYDWNPNSMRLVEKAVFANNPTNESVWNF